ncbi:glycosyltransferase [Terricaulis silvestris]|uniref:Glycosyltransferase EpsD n=1 Tax=Terricaulis silvestris TaxID=2686094 RepID=A0A6I6MI26_9CAUL|nr:glycosyltransferase [Terricaulis silvestris]QGZ94650.1 Putative glycosyltransferase EpsD [Terricaulis silvestris]
MFVLQAAVVKGRGGIATAVAHYERMFRAVGVRSAVLFSGPSTDTLREQGNDVIEAPSLLTSPLAGVLPLLSALRSAIEQRAAGEDILVIVHSDLTLPALKRLFPRARFATPCHSDKFKHKARTDLVITLNDTQHALVQAGLPSTRVALLGNPYVASEPVPLATGAAPRFNFVARFTPTKDPLTLLRAAALLSARTEIRFIGAGELDAELRAAAASSGVNATFPGWLTAPLAHFHRNDILVLPSQWEGLPYLLQEAMDHRVPIIAADNPGNRKALADGAYGDLFPFGDASALAAAMRAALADLDGLRAKAEKGRAALRPACGAEAFWRKLTAELEKSHA